MEAIRVKDKEWQLAGVHYVRTEAMCNGFGVSLEMEFGEDKAGDEYILVLDGIHPVSTCRLHQLNENTGKIERVATLKEYRGQQENPLKDSLVSVLQQQSRAGMKRIRIRKSTLLIPMQIQQSHYSISKMEQQILQSLMWQCTTHIRKNTTMM